MLKQNAYTNIIKFVNETPYAEDLNADQNFIKSTNRFLKNRFFCSQNAQALSGAHPISHSIRARVCFPVVKRPGRKPDHWLPHSAKAKNDRFHGMQSNIFTSNLQTN